MKVLYDQVAAEFQRFGANMQWMSSELLLQRNLIIQIENRLNIMDAAKLGKNTHKKQILFKTI
jgi:hypothetical protein